MKKGSINIISAEMGYGHLRAAFPLKHLSLTGSLITAGDRAYLSKKEAALWEKMRHAYEFLSRVKSMRILGEQLFSILGKLLEIEPYYPKRDSSRSTMQTRMLSSLVKRGLCSGILTDLDRDTPVVTSFYAPAIAAEKMGFKKIYCIICDADLNRVWVPDTPSKSRIIYFTPCSMAKKRLKSYGVDPSRIFNTGFPLDISVLGDRKLSVLKKDLGRRLVNLDTEGKLFAIQGDIINKYLGRKNIIHKKNRTITITYAVGGAGAQKEIGARIAKSLRKKIVSDEIILNLVAGTRTEVRDYFEKLKKEILPDDNRMKIVYEKDYTSYFSAFNNLMRQTDILWTKPSELSFFCGLGIPVIMTPGIGSQEEYNRKWLMEIGSGIPQENPDYTHEWLFDLLKYGRLAEAGWSGFIKARKCGTFKIEDILSGKPEKRIFSPLLR